ncbi:MAG: SH3 domain-containing protein [Cyanobacteria bacterium P01_A01_bin.114]
MPTDITTQTSPATQTPLATAPAASKQTFEAPTVKIYLMEPHKPGVLIGQDADTRINIRQQPTTAAPVSHYGLPGDEVRVRNYTARYEGYVWYQVRFNDSGAEGWVREDLIAITRSADARSADGVDTASLTDVNAPVVKSEEIQFAPGTLGAVIDGGIVEQGTQHEYILYASAGQQLTASLDDNNAVLQIYDEHNNVQTNLVSEYVNEAVTSWSGMLPQSDNGRYTILVRPTRGDAAYSLNVSIR